MNGLRRYAFVLAIYLNTRGFAFVLFEGPLAPVDWSVREMRGSRKDARCLARIVTILDQYLPDVLVLQDTSAQGTRRARRIVKLNEAVAALAEARGLPVYLYSRDEVSRAFESFGVTNKQGLAEIIAKQNSPFDGHSPPPPQPTNNQPP